MRKKLIAGNWKMVGTLAFSRDLVGGLLEADLGTDTVEVCVCPPFTALSTVSELVSGSRIQLGSQNMFWKDKGAYTSQISAEMLLELGVRYVIIGHSETRGRYGVPEPDFTDEVLALFGESDTTVNRKAVAALAKGLTPIICVGETLAERQAGQADTVIAAQVRAALNGISAEQAATLVFAYEPVWAIGTGETCAADEANRVCGLIRAAVAECASADAAAAVRIQYGGSVKPDNAADLLHRSDIDGALVGGAALKADSFAAIVRAAE